MEGDNERAKKGEVGTEGKVECDAAAPLQCYLAVLYELPNDSRLTY